MNVDKLFLVKSWRKHRLFTVLLLVFIALQLFFNGKTIQVTPFFLYGMYAAKAKTKAVQEIVYLEVNGKPLPYMDYLPKHRDMLVSPLYYYLTFVRNDNIDPIREPLQALGKKYFSPGLTGQLTAKLCNDSDDLKAFKLWYKRYLEETLDEPVTTYRVYLDAWAFHPEGIRSVQRKPLLSYEDPR